MKMKKILSLTTTYPTFLPWDATPPFVHELNKRLVKEWLDMYVLAPRRPWAKSFEEQDGVKIYRYPYFFLSKWEKLADGGILPNMKSNKRLVLQAPFLIFMCFIYMIKVIKKVKPDILHAQRIIINGLLATVYKGMFNNKIRIICTTQWADLFWLQWAVGTFLKKRTLAKSDQLVVVSNAMKKEAENLVSNLPYEIKVIPNWSDTDKFHSWNYSLELRRKLWIKDKMFLFVWRLAEKKWLTYLIDWVKKLVNQSIDNFKLIIIGSGPYEKQLKEQVEANNLWSYITFTWPVEHYLLPQYFASADLFTSPSIIAADWDREGLPNTYCESLASWVPVLATDLPGNLDIIKEWLTWYIVPQKDSDAIANKLINFLNQEPLDKKTISIFAEKNFSRKWIAKQYFTIFHKY